jgi:hypothetical protein
LRGTIRRMRSPLVTVAALLAVLLVSSPGAAPAPRASKPASAGHVLPWIDDDLTRAMAEAKARKLPIFVESWAPW